MQTVQVWYLKTNLLLNFTSNPIASNPPTVEHTMKTLEKVIILDKGKMADLQVGT